MTTSTWLTEATQQLSGAGVPTARLDTLVLLEDALAIDRAKLLAEPNLEIDSARAKKLTQQVTRRAAHEPLAYIRGKTEFYGREFKISSAVLEPRPESETMIELLKLVVDDLQNNYSPPTALPCGRKNDSRQTTRQAGQAPTALPHGASTETPKMLRLADVGAGSGALGITAALEFPGVQVDLLEIDPAALGVAQTNVDFFTIALNTLQSDLLAQSPQDYDILLCNLPYVPDNHTINAAALHEPHLAIFGGPDGLDIYRHLFSQIKIVDKKPLYILTESLPPQHTALASIAQKHGYSLTKTDDFIQVFALQ